MTDFKVGDKVVIIDPHSENSVVEGNLKSGLGKVFTVSSVGNTTLAIDPPFADGAKNFKQYRFALYEKSIIAQPVIATQGKAEITKGRFITDKERALIETRIALRKKLHGG